MDARQSPMFAAQLALLLASGCGSPVVSSDRDAGTDSAVIGSDAGPTVRFVLPPSGLPRPLDVPWPTDLHLDADGTIVDSLTDWSQTGIGRAASSFASYGVLDGFGVSSGAVFLVDGAHVDEASLPADPASCAGAGSPISIVDLASGARVPCRAGFSTAFSTLAVWPADRLLPGHHYAAYVTDAVRATGGGMLGATDDFRAIRDATATGAAATLYGHAIDAVVALGVARGHLLAVTPFTTQTLPPVARSLRTQLLAEQPTPTLITDDASYPMLRFGATDRAGWTATLGALMGATPELASDGDAAPGSWGDGTPAGFASSHLGAILHAAFVAPRFTRDYAQTGAPDDGTIAFDAAGHATVVDAAARIPVMFAFPSTPPPSTGWPVVIFLHGNGQYRVWAIAIANELARAGIVTVAIDIPYNGMRLAGAVDAHSVLASVGTYDGPDGAPDSTQPTMQFEAVGDFVHGLVTRDTFRQTVLDLVQLRRLIGSATLDLSPIAAAYPGATPRLDATHVGFVGISLGAVIGTLFASVEPRASVDPFVLDVDSAQLLVGLCDAPAFQAGFPLLANAFHVSRDVISHPASPFCHLVQGLMDAVDPGVVAADAASGPDGMGHAIWLLGAADDESFPRPSSDALMRAFGAIQIMPTLRPIDGLTAHASPLVPDASGRLVGYFEVAPGTHTFLEMRRSRSAYEPPWPRMGTPRVVPAPSPPLVRQPIVGTQRAIAHFMTTAWSGAPQIAVDGATYPGMTPTADFDDDGACDADETAAGTDPFDAASTPPGPGACVRNVGF
jgi:dienelactone hydrolase